jgi:predicted hotdog family 3-hydroxylacyl-ACP dehydratase
MNLLKDPITDQDFLLGLIPQKHPFVMVDKLFYFSHEKIVSGLTVTKENLFTRNEMFKEPGLIENMAQTVALHTGYHCFLKNEDAPMGYIGAITKVEIDSLPVLGQELMTTVNILHDIMGVTLVESQIECGGSLIATGKMKTVLANK